MKKFKQSSENKFKCAYEIFFNYLLFLIFRFEKWHFKSPYHCHTYKRITRDLIMDSNPEIVIEIGCGLGDILKQLANIKLRVGCDIDERVIKAAKIKNVHNNIIFYSDLKRISPSTFKHKTVTLVCVNWLHELSSEELTKFFDEVCRVVEPNTIIVDSIIENNNHRTRHNFGFLKNHSFALSQQTIEPEKIRILETWQVNAPFVDLNSFQKLE